MAARLCEYCQALFSRPEIEPRSDPNFFDKVAGHGKVAKEIQASANSGCHLCIIVWGHDKMTLLRKQKRNWEGIVLFAGLCWDVDGASFYGIRYWGRGADGTLYYDLLTVDLVVLSAFGVPSPSNLWSLDTEDEICHEIANKWMWDCTTNHPKCRVERKPSAWNPTRLVDVGTPTTEPRLVASSDICDSPHGLNYVCLTHLWDAGCVFQLRTTNEEELKQQIPYFDLSPTFQDAIQFTRRLGVRYLWIDSLCIIQDSQSDWRTESALMDKVYEFSLCNIAATAASGRSGGLYQRRDPRSMTPRQTLITRKGHEETYVFFEGQIWKNRVSKAVLNTRGWVFQERLLSPRTLHFASQFFWECRELQACETYPSGLPDESALLSDHSGELEIPSSYKDWQEQMRADISTTWTQILQIYTRCKLTRLSDRLVAIAGIAQKVQPHAKSEYLAGLWEHDLPCNLLWRLQNMVGHDLEVSRSDPYRCPTWSWASLDFSAADIEVIERADVHLELATVVEAKIQSLSGNKFSDVTGGYVRLKGKLGQVNFDSLENAPWRGDRGGHWTYECFSDEEMYDFNQESMQTCSYRPSLYCLPIAVHDRANPDTLTSCQVHCLLLEQVEEGKMDFRRAGLLLVLMDWESTVDPELRWITDFAEADSTAQDLEIITIY